MKSRFFALFVTALLVIEIFAFASFTSAATFGAGRTSGQGAIAGKGITGRAITAYAASESDIPSFDITDLDGDGEVDDFNNDGIPDWIQDLQDKNKEAKDNREKDKANSGGSGGANGDCRKDGCPDGEACNYQTWVCESRQKSGTMKYDEDLKKNVFVPESDMDPEEKPDYFVDDQGRIREGSPYGPVVGKYNYNNGEATLDDKSYQPGTLVYDEDLKKEVFIPEGDMPPGTNPDYYLNTETGKLSEGIGKKDLGTVDEDGNYESTQTGLIKDIVKGMYNEGIQDPKDIESTLDNVLNDAVKRLNEKKIDPSNKEAVQKAVSDVLDGYSFDDADKKLAGKITDLIQSNIQQKEVKSDPGKIMSLEKYAEDNKLNGWTKFRLEHSVAGDWAGKALDTLFGNPLPAPKEAQYQLTLGQTFAEKGIIPSVLETMSGAMEPVRVVTGPIKNIVLDMGGGAAAVLIGAVAEISGATEFGDRMKQYGNELFAGGAAGFKNTLEFDAQAREAAVRADAAAFMKSQGYDVKPEAMLLSSGQVYAWAGDSAVENYGKENGALTALKIGLSTLGKTSEMTADMAMIGGGMQKLTAGAEAIGISNGAISFLKAGADTAMIAPFAADLVSRSGNLLLDTLGGTKTDEEINKGIVGILTEAAALKGSTKAIHVAEGSSARETAKETKAGTGESRVAAESAVREPGFVERIMNGIRDNVPNILEGAPEPAKAYADRGTENGARREPSSSATTTETPTRTGRETGVETPSTKLKVPAENAVESPVEPVREDIPSRGGTEAPVETAPVERTTTTKEPIVVEREVAKLLPENTPKDVIDRAVEARQKWKEAEASGRTEEARDAAEKFWNEVDAPNRKALESQFPQNTPREVVDNAIDNYNDWQGKRGTNTPKEVRDAAAEKFWNELPEPVAKKISASPDIEVPAPTTTKTQPITKVGKTTTKPAEEKGTTTKPAAKETTAPGVEGKSEPLTDVQTRRNELLRNQEKLLAERDALANKESNLKAQGRDLTSGEKGRLEEVNRQLSEIENAVDTRNPELEGQRVGSGSAEVAEGFREAERISQEKMTPEERAKMNANPELTAERARLANEEASLLGEAQRAVAVGDIPAAKAAYDKIDALRESAGLPKSARKQLPASERGVDIGTGVKPGEVKTATTETTPGEKVKTQAETNAEAKPQTETPPPAQKGIVARASDAVVKAGRRALDSVRSLFDRGNPQTKEFRDLQRAVERGDVEISAEAPTFVKRNGKFEVEGDFIKVDKSASPETRKLAETANQILKDASLAKREVLAAKGAEEYTPNSGQVKVVMDMLTGNGALFPSLAGTGKTSVMIPFSAVVKAKMTGKKVVLLFKKGSIESELLPEVGKNLEFFEKAGTKAEVFDKTNPKADADIIIADTDVFFEFINNNPKSKAFIEKIKGSTLIADEAQSTLELGGRYSMSVGEKTPISSLPEGVKYSEAGNRVKNDISDAIKNAGENIGNKNGYLTVDSTGKPALKPEIKNAVLEGIRARANAEGANAKDLPALEKFVKNNPDSAAAREVNLLNRMEGIMGETAGIDFGIVNGEVAPLNKGRESGRSYSDVADVVAHEVMGRELVRAEIEKTGKTAEQAAKEVPEPNWEKSGINADSRQTTTQEMVANVFGEINGFSGTPEQITSQMARGLGISTKPKASVDLVNYQKGRPAFKDAQGVKEATDLAKEVKLNPEQTGKDQTWVLASDKISNDVAVDQVVKLTTGKGKPTEVVVVKARGAHEIRTYDANGKLIGTKTIDSMSDLNTYLTKRGFNDNQLVKVYEKGRDVGTDLPISSKEDMYVVADKGSTTTDIEQARLRDRGKGANAKGKLGSEYSDGHLIMLGEKPNVKVSEIVGKKGSAEVNEQNSIKDNNLKGVEQAVSDIGSGAIREIGRIESVKKGDGTDTSAVTELLSKWQTRSGMDLTVGERRYRDPESYLQDRLNSALEFFKGVKEGTGEFEAIRKQLSPDSLKIIDGLVGDGVPIELGLKSGSVAIDGTKPLMKSKSLPELAKNIEATTGKGDLPEKVSGEPPIRQEQVQVESESANAKPVEVETKPTEETQTTTGDEKYMPKEGTAGSEVKPAETKVLTPTVVSVPGDERFMPKEGETQTPAAPAVEVKTPRVTYTPGDEKYMPQPSGTAGSEVKPAETKVLTPTVVSVPGDERYMPGATTGQETKPVAQQTAGTSQTTLESKPSETFSQERYANTKADLTSPESIAQRASDAARDYGKRSQGTILNDRNKGDIYMDVASAWNDAAERARSTDPEVRATAPEAFKRAYDKEADLLNAEGVVDEKSNSVESKKGWDIFGELSKAESGIYSSGDSRLEDGSRRSYLSTAGDRILAMERELQNLPDGNEKKALQNRIEALKLKYADAANKLGVSPTIEQPTEEKVTPLLNQNWERAKNVMKAGVLYAFLFLFAPDIVNDLKGNAMNENKPVSQASAPEEVKRAPEVKQTKIEKQQTSPVPSVAEEKALKNLEDKGQVSDPQKKPVISLDGLVKKLGDTMVVSSWIRVPGEENTFVRELPSTGKLGHVQVAVKNPDGSLSLYDNEIPKGKRVVGLNSDGTPKLENLPPVIETFKEPTGKGDDQGTSSIFSGRDSEGNFVLRANPDIRVPASEVKDFNVKDWEGTRNSEHLFNVKSQDKEKEQPPAPETKEPEQTKEPPKTPPQEPPKTPPKQEAPKIPDVKTPTPQAEAPVVKPTETPTATTTKMPSQTLSGETSTQGPSTNLGGESNSESTLGTTPSKGTGTLDLSKRRFGGPGVGDVPFKHASMRPIYEGQRLVDANGKGVVIEKINGGNKNSQNDIPDYAVVRYEDGTRESIPFSALNSNSDQGKSNQRFWSAKDPYSVPFSNSPTLTADFVKKVSDGMASAGYSKAEIDQAVNYIKNGGIPSSKVEKAIQTGDVSDILPTELRDSRQKALQDSLAVEKGKSVVVNSIKSPTVSADSAKNSKPVDIKLVEGKSGSFLKTADNPNGNLRLITSGKDTGKIVIYQNRKYVIVGAQYPDGKIDLNFMEFTNKDGKPGVIVGDKVITFNDVGERTKFKDNMYMTGSTTPPSGATVSTLGNPTNEQPAQAVRVTVKPVVYEKTSPSGKKSVLLILSPDAAASEKAVEDYKTTNKGKIEGLEKDPSIAPYVTELTPDEYNKFNSVMNSLPADQKFQAVSRINEAITKKDGSIKQVVRDIIENGGVKTSQNSPEKNSPDQNNDALPIGGAQNARARTDNKRTGPSSEGSGPPTRTREETKQDILDNSKEGTNPVTVGERILGAVRNFIPDKVKNAVLKFAGVKFAGEGGFDNVEVVDQTGSEGTSGSSSTKLKVPAENNVESPIVEIPEISAKQKSANEKANIDENQYHGAPHGDQVTRMMAQMGTGKQGQISALAHDFDPKLADNSPLKKYLEGKGLNARGTDTPASLARTDAILELYQDGKLKDLDPEVNSMLEDLGVTPENVKRTRAEIAFTDFPFSDASSARLKSALERLSPAERELAWKNGIKLVVADQASGFAESPEAYVDKKLSGLAAETKGKMSAEAFGKGTGDFFIGIMNDKLGTPKTRMEYLSGLKNDLGIKSDLPDAPDVMLENLPRETVAKMDANVRGAYAYKTALQNGKTPEQARQAWITEYNVAQAVQNLPEGITYDGTQEGLTSEGLYDGNWYQFTNTKSGDTITLRPSVELKDIGNKPVLQIINEKFAEKTNRAARAKIPNEIASHLQEVPAVQGWYSKSVKLDSSKVDPFFKLLPQLEGKDQVVLAGSDSIIAAMGLSKTTIGMREVNLVRPSDTSWDEGWKTYNDVEIPAWEAREGTKVSVLTINPEGSDDLDVMIRNAKNGKYLIDSHPEVNVPLKHSLFVVVDKNGEATIFFRTEKDYQNYQNKILTLPDTSNYPKNWASENPDSVGPALDYAAVVYARGQKDGWKFDDASNKILQDLARSLTPEQIDKIKANVKGKLTEESERNAVDPFFESLTKTSGEKVKVISQETGNADEISINNDLAAIKNELNKKDLTDGEIEQLDSRLGIIANQIRDMPQTPELINIDANLDNLRANVENRMRNPVSIANPEKAFSDRFGKDADKIKDLIGNKGKVSSYSREQVDTGTDIYKINIGFSDGSRAVVYEKIPKGEEVEATKKAEELQVGPEMVETTSIKGEKTLVTKEINGKTLKEWVKTANTEQKKEVAKKIGEAVAKLHKNGIIQGDFNYISGKLHDQNIMITPAGEVKIIDYGKSNVRATPSDITNEKTFLESPLDSYLGGGGTFKSAFEEGYSSVQKSGESIKQSILENAGAKTSPATFGRNIRARLFNKAVEVGAQPSLGGAIGKLAIDILRKPVMRLAEKLGVINFANSGGFEVRQPGILERAATALFGRSGPAISQTDAAPITDALDAVDTAKNRNGGDLSKVSDTELESMKRGLQKQMEGLQAGLEGGWYKAETDRIDLGWTRGEKPIIDAIMDVDNAIKQIDDAIVNKDRRAVRDMIDKNSQNQKNSASSTKKVVVDPQKALDVDGAGERASSNELVARDVQAISSAELKEFSREVMALPAGANVKVGATPEEIAPIVKERLDDLDNSLKNSPQKIKVVVIGANDYQNIAPLRYALRDSDGMGEYFASQGVPAENIIRINNPTSDSFVQQVRNAMDAVKPDEIAVVYYAGHMLRVKPRSIPSSESGRDVVAMDSPNLPEGYYFALTDTRLDGRGTVSAEEIGKIIADRNVNVILDACHGGGACQIMASENKNKGLFIASAAEGQLATESPNMEHGVWTGAFLEGKAPSSAGNVESRDVQATPVRTSNTNNNGGEVVLKGDGSFSDRVEYAFQKTPLIVKQNPNAVVRNAEGQILIGQEAAEMKNVPAQSSVERAIEKVSEIIQNPVKTLDGVVKQIAPVENKMKQLVESKIPRMLPAHELTPAEITGKFLEVASDEKMPLYSPNKEMVVGDILGRQIKIEGIDPNDPLINEKVAELPDAVIREAYGKASMSSMDDREMGLVKKGDLFDSSKFGPENYRFENGRFLFPDGTPVSGSFMAGITESGKFMGARIRPEIARPTVHPVLFGGENIYFSGEVEFANGQLVVLMKDGKFVGEVRNDAGAVVAKSKTNAISGHYYDKSEVFSENGLKALQEFAKINKISVKVRPDPSIGETRYRTINYIILLLVTLHLRRKTRLQQKSYLLEMNK